MENSIFISVLIPTYNRPRYLQECLESVLEQQGFLDYEIEIIVSDNSQNDETKMVVNDIIKHSPNKNIVYNKNEVNLGMVGNWNKLLELKKGTYFIYLSDDDKFNDKESLKILYDKLREYNLDASYGKRVFINEKDESVDYTFPYKIKSAIYNNTFREEIIFFTIGFGGVLYKDYGLLFDDKTQEFADWDFNLQYLKKGLKISLINEYTFKYRIHSVQASKEIPIEDTIKKRLIVYVKYKEYGVYIRNYAFYICILILKKTKLYTPLHVIIFRR